jgi:hypothetical protein
MSVESKLEELKSSVLADTDVRDVLHVTTCGVFEFGSRRMQVKRVDILKNGHYQIELTFRGHPELFQFGIWFLFALVWGLIWWRGWLPAYDCAVPFLIWTGMALCCFGQWLSRLWDDRKWMAECRRHWREDTGGEGQHG